MPKPSSNRHTSYSMRADPVKGSDRQVRFVASTSDKARDGGVVETAGWDTKDFEKNPVILFAHNAEAPPIGRATRVQKTDKALLIDVEFAGEAQAHPLAETVFRLIKSGYLNAMSVGFNVDESREPNEEERSRGVKWVATKSTLLESSIVPIPADTGALAYSRSDVGFTAADVTTIKRHLGSIDGWSNIANEIEGTIMQKRELNESDVAYTVALRAVEDFNEETFDGFEYQSDPVVLAVTGELLDGGTVIQGLAFPKDGWEMDAAEAWLSENEKSVLEWSKKEEAPDEEPEEEPEEELAEDAPPAEDDEEEKPEEEQAEDTPPEDEEEKPDEEQAEDAPPAEEDEEDEEMPRSMIHGFSDEARSALRELLVDVLTEVMGEQAPRSADSVDSVEREAPAAESVDADKLDALLDLTNAYLGKAQK